MSWLLRSLISAVWAKEGERILAAAYDVAEKGILSNADYLQLTGTPSPAGIPDCVNLVTDPCGMGPLTTWSATGGSMRLVGTDPRDSGSDLAQPHGPVGTLGNVTCVLTGGMPGSINVTANPVTGGASYGYAYAFIDAAIAPGSAHLQVTQGGVTLATVPVFAAAQGSWQLAALPPITVTNPGVGLTITLAATGSPPAGAVLSLTAVTWAEGTDPGGPFTGDIVAVPNFGYGWQGVRNNSPSVRYGQSFDMLSMLEQQHQLPVAPEGLSPPPEDAAPFELTLPAGAFAATSQQVAYPNQRAAYLSLRNAARRHPYASTFAALLGLVIQSENPTFDASSIQVITDYTNHSFMVNIAIDPTGALDQTVQRLSADIHPAHMRLTSVNYSAFEADISQTDIGHT